MPFKKLLVLRCLRPDRITVALTSFIKVALPNGESFIDMDSKLSFSDILKETIQDAEPTIPIFFILSSGSDPVKEVEKNSANFNIVLGKSLFVISLG